MNDIQQKHQQKLMLQWLNFDYRWYCLNRYMYIQCTYMYNQWTIHPPTVMHLEHETKQAIKSSNYRGQPDSIPVKKERLTCMFLSQSRPSFVLQTKHKKWDFGRHTISSKTASGSVNNEVDCTYRPRNAKETRKSGHVQKEMGRSESYHLLMNGR